MFSFKSMAIDNRYENKRIPVANDATDFGFLFTEAIALPTTINKICKMNIPTIVRAILPLITSPSRLYFPKNVINEMSVIKLKTTIFTNAANNLAVIMVLLNKGFEKLQCSSL